MVKRGWPVMSQTALRPEREKALPWTCRMAWLLGWVVMWKESPESESMRSRSLIDSHCRAVYWWKMAIGWGRGGRDGNAMVLRSGGGC